MELWLLDDVSQIQWNWEVLGKTPGYYDLIFAKLMHINITHHSKMKVFLSIRQRNSDPKIPQLIYMCASKPFRPHTHTGRETDSSNSAVQHSIKTFEMSFPSWKTSYSTHPLFHRKVIIFESVLLQFFLRGKSSFATFRRTPINISLFVCIWLWNNFYFALFLIQFIIPMFDRV